MGQRPKLPVLVRAAGGALLAHGLFLIVLAGAFAVRWVTMEGYPSPLWFGDSHSYLEGALNPTPSVLRPSGYSLFLWGLGPFHSFTVVLWTQHALGLLTGVLVYVLVWRAIRAGARRRRWPASIIATLVTVPVLYDAYQIQLEHLVMADGLFTFLLFAAVAVVLWRVRMRWWTGALAGLLVACGALVRSVGLPMLLVVVFCMVVRRAGWRAVTAAVAAAAIPVVAYMSWFNAVHGEFTMTNTSNVWLYGRTADFADCAVIKPEPEIAGFCRDHLPPREDVAPAFTALWGADSPFRQYPDGIRDPQANELAGEFAKKAITEQPGDYFGTVLRDTFRAFEWERHEYPTRGTVEEYEFPLGASLRDWDALVAYPYGGDTAQARVVSPYSDWVRDYQDRYFVRGPVLGGLMAIGLIGVLLRVRRFGGAVLLPFGTGLALLVVPAATADFDYRYVLPAIPFAALAAGLAFARRPPVPEAEDAPEETVEDGEPDAAGPDDEPANEPEAREKETSPGKGSQGTSADPELSGQAC
ncbi:hypothetical protein HUT06_37600 [Actinomadura sp. NAK00032]|uniref:hypothetical protein n=1 Tax=Actinomadura sp. NAK00032 TaxID=2742128 RepID=UPI00159015F7|nr:hypothetical protein [Actinomadura sp. NAK00032]QKW39037.1 hypothetical protein HUT06_37600 [Actinomadura sp. NAK00032]